MSRAIDGREVVILVAACAVLVGLLPGSNLADRHWWHAHSEASSCRNNLKNISTGLEMYSTDNSGKYPRILSAVSPQFLPRIPSCPAAERDTYSAGYTSGPIITAWHSIEEGYTVLCRGRNHTASQLPENQPQVVSGLRDFEY